MAGSVTTTPDNYGPAERLARASLAGLDPRRQAQRCGARVKLGAGATTILSLEFFGKPVWVTFPAGEVTEAGGAEQIPIWERILLLHFLAGTSTPAPLTELIGFSQVPSGQFYFRAFKRRAHDPLVAAFGSRPKLLLQAGAAIGGTAAGFGSAAVNLPVLPRVPVVAVVHEADAEFPADAKLLFESSITDFFCTEDIALLGGMVAGRLIREAGRIDGGGTP